VFRYSASFQDRFLARDHPDGRREFVAVSGSPRGLGPKSLPYYLLIYGSPEVVPWSIQYMLNGTCFTGRLGLRDEALANYVAALRSGWEGSRRRRDRPVLWTVDFGGDDITHLMRQAVAEPLFSRWRSDGELVGGATLLAGTDATASRLADALAASSPALVVTTSHGATGPLSDPAAMRARLGLPVDQDHLLVGPETLAGWEPDGAIWYAHACCSAGCDGRTVYDGLVRAGSTVEATLKAIAALGARVAPLPEDLLGRKKPLAAFVGHVEPTFDWTLRQPETGQFLTATLLKALYDGMYRAKPEPVGLALDACYDHVGELLRQSWQAQTRFAQEADPKRRREWQLAATRTQLMALDRQAMVVLGDPTACLPTGGE
jgi:hypothetical protein